ncbi:polyprenyl synthetase family protein [Tissierellaceae bacterium HCP3S3_D8]|jgi:geranylgeranyl diphosphate synthase type II
MTIINGELNKTREIIDEKLKEYLKIDNIYVEKILESIKYSLFTGGKRLRPIIMVKTFEIFDDNIENVLPYASALEMIHTYSLVHDDLPAMDDDNMRRGKPTNHIVFGEAMAILTGDALLNLAFEIMLDDVLNTSMSNDEYRRKSRAIYEIGNYSGIRGMIGGQVVDLFGNYRDMDRDRLIYMYKTKTAALFQASVVAGAILGGASEEEVSILRDFALYLGLAYQIQDDLLDFEEDALIDKLTYLSYFDRDKANRDMREYRDRAISILESLKSRNTDFLRELTMLLANRKK